MISGRERTAAILTMLLALNGAYLAAFNSATLFYMANVLLHFVAGVALVILLLTLLRRAKGGARLAALLLIGSALPALYLVIKGNTLEQRAWLYAHIAIAAAGAAALCVWAWPRYRRFGPLLAGSLAALALLPLAAHLQSRWWPNPADRIRNQAPAPASMEEEGEGPRGPFWPSSARTNQGLIPADYFLDSEQCGSCHKDIYEQWRSSVHHFASFNNQFYRKSIEYMQQVQGSTKPSRWCAGCHDHALLFSGLWEKPVREQIDAPEAQAGLACVSCHSIAQVHDTIGNGGFTLDYNRLHEIAASKNRYVQAFDRFLTFLNPKPHRRTFLKPFHRLDSSEFCSTCHKVHLDVPVNNYRWIRGFNDYDNWQASGVSGRGARSFYYPKESSTCSTCHMPLVRSNDPGNRGGFVHSHRFPGANMAVALANNDREQMEVTRQFLQSGFITVDVFAASPVEDAAKQVGMVRRAGEAAPAALSTFAVGEEAEAAGQVFLREVGRVAAPLDRTSARFEPGSTVRVDVVVRTRKIGHFFPGGTVDAFDVWLEVEAIDAAGRHIFWSGRVEDGGRGPVETGAHFYRSYQLDAEGNPINKRNAWQTRSLLYVRLIPPGAADTAHFRIPVPAGAKGPITLKAKLNYRKFEHYYTQFAYAGEPEPGQESLVSLNQDSRRFSFAPANIPQNVSGKIKNRIPDLPVITLAENKVELQLAGTGEKTAWSQTIRPEDYERWNDWGIGLLLQGDLKGAEYAFRKVMEAKPDYADGPVNAARALIQEGETEAAKPLLRQAMKIQPGLARAHFFQAMVEKADGRYDAAIASLNRVLEQYPEDRVALNQLGRLLFLKRDYAGSVSVLDRVMRVDPEDLQAHYTLMLCYRGLNRTEMAQRHARLFQRFKADESAQTITARPRLLRPEDNNERQMIHDHESVRLP